MDSLHTITNHPFIHKHGPTVALFASIICLVTLITLTGLDMRGQAKIKAENYTPQAIKPIRTNKRSSYRINDVVSANLFGDPKPVVEVKQAPKTTLDLTLQGILSATDKSVARAIISSGRSKRAELYSIGEEIKGAGALVKEIRDQEVILNRNGAIESLPLKKKTSKGDTSIFTPVSAASSDNIDRQSGGITSSSERVTRPTSANGEPRKIRKPNFSGLDRALEKLGEL